MAQWKVYVIIVRVYKREIQLTNNYQRIVSFKQNFIKHSSLSVSQILVDVTGVNRCRLRCNRSITESNILRLPDIGEVSGIHGTMQRLFTYFKKACGTRGKRNV
jgi:hypothetical protein